MIRALRDETEVALKSIGTAIKSKEYSFPSNFTYDGGIIDGTVKTMKGGKIFLKVEAITGAVSAASDASDVSFTVKHKAKSTDTSYKTVAVYGPFKASDLNATEIADNICFMTELPRTMYANFQIEASGTAFTSGSVRMVIEG